MMEMKKPILILVTLIVLAIACGIVMFSYRPQDNTVAPQMEGKQERTDRMTSTATEIGEPHKDSEETTPVETPEQVEREISEIIEHLEALHAPEPVAADEENPTEQTSRPCSGCVGTPRIHYPEPPAVG